MSQQSPSMDSSMYTSTIQPQFPNSSFSSTVHFQDEALFFPTNLSQNVNLEDQVYWS
jgi:hypothetical protein